jgi:hypothetical protein
MPDQQPSWPIGVPQPPDKWSWEHFWEAWLSTMVRSVDIGWLNSLIENGIPHVVAAFVATMLSTRATTARVLGRAIAEVETEADPILLGMAAAGLSDYFETPISAEQLGGPGNRSHRQGLIDQLSGLVLTQLFGTFGAGGTISPATGAQNAERVIGFNLSTALEGWLEGLLGPGFLHDWIPTYADLDDVISQNLGLGRLTRRVLTPLMNALIVTPYTQHLNATFRPSIYSESQAVRAMNRGQLTEPEYYDLMARLGWDREKAGELRVILGPVASLDQIRGFLELGLVDSAGAKALISAQGYDPNTAGLLLQNIRQDRIRTLRTEAVSVARAMFAARELTEGELDETLSAAGLTALERDAVKVVAGLQRSRPTAVPRGTMEDAYELDLISSAELTGFYEHEGYSARSREIMLGLVLKKKAVALEAKAKRDSAAAAKLHRPLSQSAAMELHRRGLITSPALGNSSRCWDSKGTRSSSSWPWPSNGDAIISSRSSVPRPRPRPTFHPGAPWRTATCAAWSGSISYRATTWRPATVRTRSRSSSSSRPRAARITWDLSRPPRLERRRRRSARPSVRRGKLPPRSGGKRPRKSARTGPFPRPRPSSSTAAA